VRDIGLLQKKLEVDMSKFDNTSSAIEAFGSQIFNFMQSRPGVND
jgi:hypothetical protein